MYNMETALVDYINAQRKEAEEFSKQPGCWMGMMPSAAETEYWSDRVPSGTLREYMRIQLEEDAYYITADYVSKSYARSLDFANWKDSAIERHIENICREKEAA
tara:strand:- start:282 stop:593 length:312 start_codon:yes stop_codon:yes gene_type:complete